MRKALIDLTCEGLNLGIVGLLAVLALAQPAFRLTSDDDWLKRQDLAVTFLDRYGVEVGRRGIKHDDAIPFDELPDHFIKAVLATEDRRFFDHFGIDVVGTLRALTVNAHAGGVVQGGSSITQQLAKNLFLSNERSISRKINEAYLALWLEHHLTKKQILSLYLDRAYMGGGAFGVQAAAQYYFGKSARDINLAEAAMLAGLFKAPTKYSPNVNLPAARARANDVLSNLVDAGFMTEGQVYAARRNPATPVDQNADIQPRLVSRLRLRRGEGARRRRQARRRPRAHRAHRARHRAAAQGRKRHRGHAARQRAGLQRASGGGGGRRHRRAGAGDGRRPRLWREPVQPRHRRGAPARLVVQDLRLSDRAADRQVPQATRRSTPRGICIGDYCVHNFDGESGGAMPLYQALAQSFNTAAIWMSVKIGEAYWPAGKPYHLAKIAELGRSKIVETARKHGADDAARRHGVAAGRRRRSQDDRHGRRQRHARQRRQARDALRGDRDPQFAGRR